MHHLIPAPRRADGDGGRGFVPDGATTITAGPGTGGTERWLRTTLGAAFGLPLAPGTVGAEEAAGTIELRIDPALEPEGYRLTVVPDRGVRITGGSEAGVFWGAQTLRQLLGPEAFRRAPVGQGAARGIPATEIEDGPRFGWRGLMLDVARHFTPKDDVLRMLDLLAAHKLNVFHFHLTDDQGWRVEIKRYPRLTEVGAWRARTKYGHRASELWDETPHGGFYTQDDIREIVAYAAERHIRVVPEIDIPGHSQAAVSAYPELGNTDVVDTSALSVWDTWGVNPNVLAPTDHTLRFFEGVFEELLDLFPADTSPFIHVGGDECPKDQWRQSPTAQARIAELGLKDEDELQSWFIRHFDRWLTDRGRLPSAGTRSWRAASPRAPPCPRGKATPEGSLPPRPGTTSSCAPCSRCTWTTVRTPPTSRCPSGTSAPWRTCTASSPCRPASPRRRPDTSWEPRSTCGPRSCRTGSASTTRSSRGSPPSPRSPGPGSRPPASGTSPASNGAWRPTTPGSTPWASTTGRPPARCRGNAVQASWVARSRDRPRSCDQHPTPWPGEPNKSYEIAEEVQFVRRAEALPKVTFPLVGDGIALRGPSRRTVRKMCQSCHVPAVSTYRTADRRDCRDTGKGQLG